MGIQGIVVKGFQIPTDANGQLWVHYSRRDPSIYVPAPDVLDGRVASERIAGKLVLIGTSSVGLNEFYIKLSLSVLAGVALSCHV